MRGALVALFGAVLLLLPAMARADRPGRPEPSRCPALAPLEEPLNDRTKPLPVPRHLAMLVSAGRDQLAVATIYGGTVCVDARPMTAVRNFTVSTDRRFVEFDWTGYEADGHVVVDRSGKGQVIETGASPVSSPSRRRFAAIQQSEAGFGGLEGFAVWQVDLVGLRRLTLQQDIPSLVDWRIDRWTGDDCVELSGIPSERIPDSRVRLARLPREHYAAMKIGGGWTVAASDKGCPAAKAPG